MYTDFRENRESGFTLAELLIVVAIIAVLVAVSIPVFFSSLERSRATVCESNRTSLVHQIIVEHMMDDTFGQEEAEKLVASSDAHCPSGGTYRVEMDEFFVKLECDKHKATSGAIEDEKNKVSSGLLKDFRSFINGYSGSYLDNDILRREFYKANGEKWPTITVDGVTLYIQPFFKKQSTGESVENRTWLFAKTDSSAASGWNANLVFDAIDGKWYRATDYKGDPDIKKASVINNYNNINELHESVLNETKENGKPVWVEVTDYVESGLDFGK